jgi:hypothetical protein
VAHAAADVMRGCPVIIECQGGVTEVLTAGCGNALGQGVQLLGSRPEAQQCGQGNNDE